MKRIILIILIVCIAGCSTTVINSVPDNANLYLNGEKVGTTPYTYTDGKTLFSSTTVTLKKEGYEDTTYEMSKDEQFRWWIIPVSLFGGFVPLLWVKGFKPTHTYELTPQKSVSK